MMFRSMEQCVFRRLSDEHCGTSACVPGTFCNCNGHNVRDSAPNHKNFTFHQRWYNHSSTGFAREADAVASAHPLSFS